MANGLGCALDRNGAAGGDGMDGMKDLQEDNAGKPYGYDHA